MRGVASEWRWFVELIAASASDQGFAPALIGRGGLRSGFRGSASARARPPVFGPALCGRALRTAPGWAAALFSEALRGYVVYRRALNAVCHFM